MVEPSESDVKKWKENGQMNMCFNCEKTFRDVAALRLHLLSKKGRTHSGYTKSGELLKYTIEESEAHLRKEREKKQNRRQSKPNKIEDEASEKDVLVVKANSNDAFGQKERLIPFIKEQVISNVDIAGKLITVNWEPDF